MERRWRGTGAALVLALCIGWQPALSQSDGRRWSWPLEEALAGEGVLKTRGRSLQSVVTIKGLPNRFSIRPLIDPTLCVTLADLASTAGLAAVRQASGLPATDPDETSEYGSARLVLLPCTEGPDEIFLAETVLGRFYFNNNTNYRQGFLKPVAANDVCVYGANASYTAGRRMFGVSVNASSDGLYGGGGGGGGGGAQEEGDEMEWFDEYNFDYAPYIRYGYNASTTPFEGVFRSPNPLPANMLDASGWGPFHSAWGACMHNPTLDSAAPTEDPSTEVQLRYMSWVFVGVAGTPSVSHLPRKALSNAFALMTLGPDRPQPDMSPLAGQVDAGDLSAQLGGTDRPYGNGYSSLVSNELCMTASSMVAGAQVRLAQCNPVAPSLEQAFQLQRKAPKPPKPPLPPPKLQKRNTKQPA